jgi:probable F420-dependent oxidoreductase
VSLPPLRLGAVFPQTEIGADPGAVRAFAQGVEELGFHHVLAYDHVLGADGRRHRHLVGPYRAEHLFHEVLVLFGYLACVAPRLELVTGVVIAPQRQTALLAKQAAEIDILTGGRFRLGLGLGWNDVEYEALGMSFHDRGRRLEEQVELMRLLWTQPLVDFQGRWHRVTAAGLNPLPVQRPIPIWIGGSAEPALRRAARLAQGYFPQRPLEGGWPATIERLRGWLEEAGRDPRSFGIDARVSIASGAPEDWRREAEEWRRLGATHITLVTLGGGLAIPDAQLERLRQGKEALQGL